MKEGRLYKTGRISVLELCGNHLDMGCLYGSLLREQLHRFYEVAIEDYFLKKSRIPYLKLFVVSKHIFHRYSRHIKELFVGMSRASGISLTRIVMLDQINAFEFLRNQNIGRCSNIAVWGGYTEDGLLILGRNFDQPESFGNFNEFLTLALLRPEDGIPVASLGYAGQVGISTGINGRGVFIADNEAPTLKSDRVDTKIPNILIMQLDFLMKASGLDELDSMIRAARANCPIIVSAGDGKRSRTFECTTSGLKLRSADDDGLLVTTNNFAHPDWDRPGIPPDAYHMTLKRRANLLSLAGKRKGRFTVETMKEVLGTAIDRGGATHADNTTCQIILVPERLEMHFKVPGFQDWVRLDLEYISLPGRAPVPS